MSFLSFFQAAFSTPLGGLVVAATLGVLFVNGWTDAPNAIAAGISTHAFTMRQGILLATLMNILGAAACLFFGKQVAKTVFDLGAFPKGAAGSLALAAAMLAVILWAILAWRFGIPTSESHALMAGLMGAALALRAGGISLIALFRVLLGMVLSSAAGCLGGWVFTKLFLKKERSPALWRGGQILSAALMAFAHGAQDAPKFASVLILGSTLWGGTEGFSLPLWMLLLSGAVMGLGTLLGGGRIIRKVGSEMVHISQREGFAADLAGTLSLLFSTLQGMPVSTTHVKTCALMGAAMGAGEDHIDQKIALSMGAMWLLTFPFCGLLGFLLTKFFLIF
ncbi:MAG: inorganic phosphate transporter [Clostridia bacterium]|nr:inorganic phosphate transporter [Clostridia bacterium]